MSASQIDKFALCMAKWGYEYLDGHTPPPHPSAQCGTRVHEILEAWLSKGIPPNPDEVLVIGDRVYEVGKIAIAGLYNLPTPGPHHDVEGSFDLPFLSGYPAVWRGFIDSSYVVMGSGNTQIGRVSSAEVLVTTPEGIEVLGHVEMTPEILDHKTTTNLDYRKLPSDLATDVQAILYAAVGLMRVPTAQRVNLRWVYYKTTKPYKSEVSYTTLTREHVMQTLALWEQLAVAGPLRAKALGLRAAQLPKNPRACSRYGGCPHKDVRCRLTRSERIDAIMSQGEDLMSMIQNAHTALANPAPPPPTDAATAPLLGAPPQFPPQAPMGGLPPAPQFEGVPGAYPAFQPPQPQSPQPPQPWLPQQPPQMAYPTPQSPQTAVLPQQPQQAYPTPQSPQTAVQPPPVFLPPQTAYPVAQTPQPPQMAYPVAQTPQAPQPPPAPPQVPSVTTHWPKELRDAVVGAIRTGWSDQQIVAQYGAYAPGMADTLPQLRKDLVTIDEYTAKTSMPTNVQPLTAAEEYGIKFAIQSGATDAQICAHYPHARPHLDRLRLEVQGPQRATGINAPESAGQPQLAQPAPAPAATPSTNGSNGEHDPSMVGDAFDKMGKDELRKLAEQNNIDVKGLREKNLRIQVRNAMKDRQPQPGAPAPAAQNTNMQPQMLPGLFPPVATQSINQAVQTHLAQPQPQSQSQPVVLTGAAADAIRQALNHLNKVGDELRKLIGAD